MQEIDEEQLERQIAEAQDPDLLKELMGYAIHLERDDLVEIILERSIRNNRLVEKLQDYEMQPVSLTFLSQQEQDESEADFAEDDEAEEEADAEEALDEAAEAP
ncbi:MAG TPA: hypothetical protein V6D23_20740 [Candidatus Obscuribacterales bacterium]